MFVWHRDTLNALISNHPGIRDAFPALLTIGDILTRPPPCPAKSTPRTWPQS